MAQFSSCCIDFISAFQDKDMTLKSHQLHGRQDRQNVFNNLPENVWREESMVSNWVVTDPHVIIDVLRRPHSAMPDWSAFMQMAEKALGIPLYNLRKASQYTPLLLNESEHAILRKNLAVYLAARLKELEPSLPETMNAVLAPLEHAGRLNLHRDIALPIVRKVTQKLLNCPLPPGFEKMSLFEVFPAVRSPAKSRRVDQEFGQVFHHLAPYVLDEADMACKICCLIFGVDTLNMLIVENILLALRAHGPAELAEYPIETGVPVTNRTPDQDWQVGAHVFERGQVVRLQLQALGYSDVAQHKAAMFGTGMHACVGKQVSLRVWHHLRTTFNRIAPRAKLVEYKLIPSAAICLYESVIIEIEP
jgi:hypothetical protein